MVESRRGESWGGGGVEVGGGGVGGWEGLGGVEGRGGGRRGGERGTAAFDRIMAIIDDGGLEKPREPA